MGMCKIFMFLLVSLYLEAAPLLLSEQEKKIIQSHPVTCISTGLWAPFNLIENDKLVGIGFDYWDLIKDKLQLKSRCEKAESWTEVLQAIKNKTADLTVAGQSTEERYAYAVFSKPYASYPIVIATRNDVGYIDDIQFLHDKTIVVGKNYAMASLLHKYYPSLNIQYVDSLDKALGLIDQGKAYATLEILPVLAYKLNKNGYYNLKISGRIPYKDEVSIMLRKDYQLLVPLINKAIDAITVEEKAKIASYWLDVHHNKISYENLYSMLFLLTLLLVLVSLWLFSLHKKIKNKNQTEKELKKLVYLDFLTSIYNRHMLDISLEKEIALSNRYDKPMSIIFFDIDMFKHINDTYGHKQGDTILEEIAELISSNIRGSDILGRWGGDEFLLILPNTAEEEAKKLSTKLYTLIKEHIFKIDTPVTCSFGVTEYEEGDTKKEIIIRADRLLYEHKTNGDDFNFHVQTLDPLTQNPTSL